MSRVWHVQGRRCEVLGTVDDADAAVVWSARVEQGSRKILFATGLGDRDLAIWAAERAALNDAAAVDACGSAYREDEAWPSMVRRLFAEDPILLARLMEYEADFVALGEAGELDPVVVARAKCLADEHLRRVLVVCGASR